MISHTRCHLRADPYRRSVEADELARFLSRVPADDIDRARWARAVTATMLDESQGPAFGHLAPADKSAREVIARSRREKRQPCIPVDRRRKRALEIGRALCRERV